MLKNPDNRFREVLSDRPIAKPTRLKVPSQSEKILALVRLEQMRAQQDREVETFEEADDFELDDGEEWFSPYEEIFEAPEVPPEPITPPAEPPVAPPATET